MVSRRVLVVEVDWKIRRLIRTNLEALGLEVVEARDGTECLQALRDLPYDLILLGVDLPDGNGWNLIWRLRREAANSETPIVAIVADPARGRLLRRLARVTELQKPFSALALLQSVDSALAPRSTGVHN